MTPVSVYVTILGTPISYHNQTSQGCFQVWKGCEQLLVRLLRRVLQPSIIPWITHNSPHLARSQRRCGRVRLIKSQRLCKVALCWPARLQFQALILSQSHLKYPYFLFSHFFFARFWFRSIKPLSFMVFRHFEHCPLLLSQSPLGPWQPQHRTSTKRYGGVARCC